MTQMGHGMVRKDGFRDGSALAHSGGSQNAWPLDLWPAVGSIIFGAGLDLSLLSADGLSKFTQLES